jgi:MFS family permease
MAKITPDQRIESLEELRTDAAPDDRAGHVERGYDRRDGRFVGGISLAGMLLAGAVGAAIGALVMLLIDGDLWWAGAAIGFFTGGVIGGLVPARFALEGLEREVRPPAETKTPDAGGRPR